MAKGTKAREPSIFYARKLDPFMKAKGAVSFLLVLSLLAPPPLWASPDTLRMTEMAEQTVAPPGKESGLEELQRALSPKQETGQFIDPEEKLYGVGRVQMVPTDSLFHDSLRTLQEILEERFPGLFIPVGYLHMSLVTRVSRLRHPMAEKQLERVAREENSRKLFSLEDLAATGFDLIADGEGIKVRMEVSDEKKLLNWREAARDRRSDRDYHVTVVRFKRPLKPKERTELLNLLRDFQGKNQSQWRFQFSVPRLVYYEELNFEELTMLDRAGGSSPVAPQALTTAGLEEREAAATLRRQVVKQLGMESLVQRLNANLTSQAQGNKAFGVPERFEIPEGHALSHALSNQAVTYSPTFWAQGFIKGIAGNWYLKYGAGSGLSSGYLHPWWDLYITREGSGVFLRYNRGRSTVVKTAVGDIKQYENTGPERIEKAVHFTDIDDPKTWQEFTPSEFKLDTHIESASFVAIDNVQALQGLLKALEASGSPGGLEELTPEEQALVRGYQDILDTPDVSSVIRASFHDIGVIKPGESWGVASFTGTPPPTTFLILRYPESSEEKPEVVVGGRSFPVRLARGPSLPARLKTEVFIETPDGSQASLPDFLKAQGIPIENAAAGMDPFITEPAGSIFQQSDGSYIVVRKDTIKLLLVRVADRAPIGAHAIPDTTRFPGRGRIPPLFSYHVHPIAQEAGRMDHLSSPDVESWTQSLIRLQETRFSDVIPEVIFEEMGRAKIFIPRTGVDWRTFMTRKVPALKEWYRTHLTAGSYASKEEFNQQVEEWEKKLHPYFIIASIQGFESAGGLEEGGEAKRLQGQLLGLLNMKKIASQLENVQVKGFEGSRFVPVGFVKGTTGAWYLYYKMVDQPDLFLPRKVLDLYISQSGRGIHLFYNISKIEDYVNRKMTHAISLLNAVYFENLNDQRTWREFPANTFQLDAHIEASSLVSFNSVEGLARLVRELESAGGLEETGEEPVPSVTGTASASGVGREITLSLPSKARALYDLTTAINKTVQGYLTDEIPFGDLSVEQRQLIRSLAREAGLANIDQMTLAQMRVTAQEALRPLLVQTLIDHLGSDGTQRLVGQLKGITESQVGPQFREEVQSLLRQSLGAGVDIGLLGQTLFWSPRELANTVQALRRASEVRQQKIAALQREIEPDLDRYGKGILEGTTYMDQEEKLGKIIEKIKVSGMGGEPAVQQLEQRARAIVSATRAVRETTETYRHLSFDPMRDVFQTAQRSNNPLTTQQRLVELAGRLIDFGQRLNVAIAAIPTENPSLSDQGRRAVLERLQRDLSSLEDSVQERQRKAQEIAAKLQPAQQEEQETQQLLDQLAAGEPVVVLGEPGSTARRVRVADWEAVEKLFAIYIESIKERGRRDYDRVAYVTRLVETIKAWPSLNASLKAKLLVHLLVARGWMQVQADGRIGVVGRVGQFLESLAASELNLWDQVEEELSALSFRSRGRQPAMDSAGWLRRFFQIYHHVFYLSLEAVVTQGAKGVMLFGRVRRYVPVIDDPSGGAKRITQVEPIETNMRGGFQLSRVGDEVFVLLDDTKLDLRIVGLHEFQHLLDTAESKRRGVPLESWELEYLAYLRTAIMLSKWLEDDQKDRLDPWKLFDQIFGPEGYLDHYLKAQEHGETVEEHVMGTDRSVREFLSELIGRNYRDKALARAYTDLKGQGLSDERALQSVVEDLKRGSWSWLRGYLNVLKNGFRAQATGIRQLATELMERFYKEKFGEVPVSVRYFLEHTVTDTPLVEVFASDGSWTEWSRDPIRTAAGLEEDAKEVVSEFRKLLAGNETQELIQRAAKNGELLNLSEEVQGLLRAAQEAGYEGEVLFIPLQALPPQHLEDVLSIYTQEIWEENLKQSLKSARGVEIHFVPTAEDADLIVADILFTPEGEDHAPILQIDAKTVKHVTPEFITYLEEKKLLQRGAIVVVGLVQGEFGEGLLIFA